MHRLPNSHSLEPQEQPKDDSIFKGWREAHSSIQALQPTEGLRWDITTIPNHTTNHWQGKNLRPGQRAKLRQAIKDGSIGERLKGIYLVHFSK